ncbi:polymorphic toxin-type HINT domain-containing protein [Chromobacterium violaceum]|uniref:polymorphic toxin-type HINT domain-containing protein n=1 Tax=Chromobacterium violaceum TaxID=536 RepID=UPI0039F64A25
MASNQLWRTRLVDHAGQPLVVVSQEREGELNTVFNIQVAEFQTYHVGELGVWVHNAGP